MPLEAGTRVGRYTISRLLAQGGMAEVYRAEQPLAGGISRPVAVKVIRPEYSESDDFRQMFLDEARTACTLSHPNIVHIYEVGESDDGLLFMVMELVPGETLATVNRTLREHGERFSDEALFAIGVACASALEAVHALRVEEGTVNLVHRDVSPHNLLLSPSGAVKLIDFGIAKAATNRNLTMPGVTKGKAGYFSPEQAMGKKLDGRSDLFSLGVTLYKLASGETPFDDFKNHAERHAALVRGQWKPLHETFAGLPDGFYDVVDKALAVKPDDRFQTAREMREALEKAAFDAGLRIGQSSLLGFVDEDGEITASGGTRMSAFPAITASPSMLTQPLNDERPPPVPITAPPTQKTLAGRSMQQAVTAAPNEKSVRQLPPIKHQTERLSPVEREKQQRRARRTLFAVAFASAVTIGVFGVLAVASGWPEPERTEYVEPPKVAVEIPQAAVEPVKVPPPPVEPDVTVDDEPVKIEPVAVEPAKVEPPAKPVKGPKTPKEPKPKLVAKAPPVEKPAEKIEPPKEEAIPAGEGKLRVNVSNTASAKVYVGSEDWGDPPVDKRVSSGTYRVTVKLPDGSSSSGKAQVFPDQITTVIFDATTQKWNVTKR